MRKGCLLTILLVFSCLLSACTYGGGNITASYELYFPSKDKDFGAPALRSETCQIQDGEEAIPELLRILLKGPSSESLQAVIPAGVTVRDWTLKDGVLTVDFSSQYGMLSGIDLTLADYSVTMSLSQVPEVSSVVTMVEGETIGYRDRETLKEDDVLFGVSRNEPMRHQVTLFFPRKDREDFGQESRTLLLTQDDSLLPAVLSALVAGPESRGFESVFWEGDVISSELKDGACSLNLSHEFYARASQDPAVAARNLKSVLTTLFELETIGSVRFLQNGEPVDAYGPIAIKDPMVKHHLPAELS